MNERIRELADQAGVSITAANKNGVFTLLPDSQKKFAELIVQECVKVAHPKLTDVGEWAAGMRLVQQRLKQHFGVEE